MEYPIKLADSYIDLQRKNEFYEHLDVTYDFWQHDDGTVYFFCGWGDSLKEANGKPGRVWAVIPDQDVLLKAMQKVPLELLAEYTTRTFKEMTSALVLR